MTRSLIFDDIGSYGLRAFSGFVREEILPQLLGREAQRAYREMLDNSSVVGSIIFAITQAMRSVTWRVEPPNDSSKAKELAEFTESMMDDMSTTWDDFVGDSLSMLGYGFAVHEIVYKRRMGRFPVGKDVAASKHNDGLISWRRLPGRGQDTVIKWFFDENGAVHGLTQQPYSGPQIDLPIEKLLLFRPHSPKNNPEGRALDPETMVPTPDGWHRLDDLSVGDKVFDEQGCIRYITARADWDDRPCYRVTFGDGTSIVADENHQWVTRSLSERNRSLPPRVRTTAQIAGTVKTGVGSSNHSIAWARPLDYPEQMLPIDPYYLGLWLGDGSSRNSSIACHAQDVGETVQLIEACGYSAEVSVNGGSENGRMITVTGDKRWDPQGPASLLSALGLRCNKHIPAAYLRGSIEQRRALLAGLMDSDGHADNYGRCEFVNCNMGLIYGVVELVRSLGCSATLGLRHKANGDDRKQDSWVVRFRPDWSPFRLSRKVGKAREGRARDNHYIVSVEPVETRRTVCIEVDSPSHLFLAGEGMIPTHNSVLRNSYRAYYFIKRLEELEAIGVERLNGFPVISLPSELIERATSVNPGTGAPADPQAAQAYAAYKKMAVNIRMDEQMGAVLPSDVYVAQDGKPSTARMFNLEFLTPQHGAGAKHDTDKIITRYKIDILMTVLADFIQMGHEVRGTNNLAVTKVDMFYQAIEGWLNNHAAILNRYALPRLWKLNGFNPDLMPEFKPDMAQRLDLDSLGAYVTALAGAGMPMFPDEDLQKFLREAGGMPEDTAPEAMKAAAQVLAASIAPKGPAQGNSKGGAKAKPKVAKQVDMFEAE